MKQEMIGRRFGRLTVIAESEKKSKNRQTRWVCQCDCGTIAPSVNGSHLRSGITKSCGCFKREETIKRNFRHGLSYTRIHKIWEGMKTRCYNPKNRYFNHYGGRGITVCDEWMESLQSFHDWAMKNGYSDNLSIDRKDTNGNYCPENCRWVDMKTQQNNRRTNILVEINGKTQTLSQWATETGVKYRTLHARYRKGWTGENLIRKV